MLVSFVPGFGCVALGSEIPIGPKQAVGRAGIHGIPGVHDSPCKLRSPLLSERHLYRGDIVTMNVVLSVASLTIDAVRLKNTEILETIKESQTICRKN